MTHIPDEAVQAFIERYEIGCNHRYDKNSIRAALIAALPHLQLGYEVKKLEWKLRANGGFTCIDDNEYCIDFWENEQLYVGSYTTMERSKNADDVKEALQKKFERRVRECVVTKPVDVAAVRRQALEEAEQDANSDIIKELKDAIAWRKRPWEGRHKATLEILERALSAIIAFSVDTSPKNSLNLSNVLRHAFISGFEAKGGTITEAINHWPDYNPEQCQAYERVVSALSAEPAQGERKYKLGDRLTKTKGSRWTGRVVGFYSTKLTPIGYAIESETETGSVQIYPEAALTSAEPESGK